MAAGNTYVTGSTGSLADFPSTGGALHATAGSATAWTFIYKLNSNRHCNCLPLRRLVELPASSSSTGTGIAVDSLGNAYVTGTTSSFDFPTTASAFQTGPAGPALVTHGFALKLNTTGSALTYSTYLRSSGTDLMKGIAIDGSGNAYIAGQTYEYVPNRWQFVANHHT